MTVQRRSPGYASIPITIVIIVAAGVNMDTAMGIERGNFDTTTVPKFGELPLENGNYSLVCHSETDTPSISYKWYKEWSEVNDNSSKYRGVRTKELTILNLKPFDAGEYRCRINDNMDGHVVGFILSVLYKPRVTIFGPVSVLESRSAALTCNVSAYPLHDSLVWYHNGSVLPTLEENSVIYELNSTQWRDQGTYRCEVSNHVGTGYSEHKLTVLGTDRHLEDGRWHNTHLPTIIGLTVIVGICLIIGVALYCRHRRRKAYSYGAEHQVVHFTNSTSQPAPPNDYIVPRASSKLLPKTPSGGATDEEPPYLLPVSHKDNCTIPPEDIDNKDNDAIYEEIKEQPCKPDGK